MKKLKGFLLFFVCCLLSCVTAVSLTACNGEKNSVTDGQTVGSFNENQAAADTGSTSGTVSYLYSIQLDAKGAKNQFKIGEEFSGDGIKMTAVIYDVGTSVNTRNVDVTKDVVIDASAFNNKKPGSYKIYVSYTYEGTTLYSNYTVNVVSAIEGTIAGLVMEYNGARQAELSSAATKASLDISGLKVSLITGKDANNTAIKLLERSEYSLSYSKDGGELVPVAENVTSITDLTRGTYSFFATSEYKSGAESFTMTSFFTFYVLDPVESFTKDEGGTVEFEYDTDKVIGEDWKYTVRYASGAEEKLDYSDVEMGEAVNDEEGAQSVAVTYSEEQLGFDSALNDAVSKKYSKTCEVAYEIGENPNAGAEVTESIEMNMEDVFAALGGTIADGTELITADVAASGIFVVRSSGMQLEANASGDYTYRLKFGGKLANGALKIVTKGKATVTIAVRSSSSDERPVGVYTELDNSATSIVPTQAATSEMQLFEFEIPEAGTYYLGSTVNAVNVYYISLEQTYISGGSGTVTPSPVTLNVSDLTATTYTEAETDLTGDGSITVLAKEDKEVVIDSHEKTVDGITFTQRMKLGGTGTIDARSIKLDIKGPATITVYAMSGSSSSDRVLNLNDENFDTIVNDQVALGASVTKLVYNVSESGTYYLASASSGINIYYIITICVNTF